MSIHYSSPLTSIREMTTGLIVSYYFVLITSIDLIDCLMPSMKITKIEVMNRIENDKTISVNNHKCEVVFISHLNEEEDGDEKHIELIAES